MFPEPEMMLVVDERKDGCVALMLAETTGNSVSDLIASESVTRAGE